jgi:hypothetical protein
MVLQGESVGLESIKTLFAFATEPQSSALLQNIATDRAR